MIHNTVFKLEKDSLGVYHIHLANPIIKAGKTHITQGFTLSKTGETIDLLVKELEDIRREIDSH